MRTGQTKIQDDGEKRKNSVSIYEYMPSIYETGKTTFKFKSSLDRRDKSTLVYSIDSNFGYP